MFDVLKETRKDLKDPRDFVLKFSYAPMQHIEFYLINRDGKTVDRYLTGKDFPFESRPIVHHQYVFPLQIESAQQYTVMLRLETTGSMQLPISIVTRRDFNKSVGPAYLAFGVYYGLILLVIMISLFVFMSLRDREFLSYAIYVFAVAMSQASLHGLSYQILWPNAVYWNTVSSVFFMGMTSSSLAVFTIRFLNLKRLSPVLSRCLQVYGAVCFSMAISSLFLYGPSIIRGSGYILALMTGLMLCAGGVAVRKRHPQGWYYLTAILAYLVSVFLYSLKEIGIVPTAVWTEYGIIFGSLIEVCVFSGGLANKIRRIDRAAREAEIRIQRSSAIASMTQMLAHDVRKPFSILKPCWDPQVWHLEYRGRT